MRIQVELFATLADYRPRDAPGGGPLPRDARRRAGDRDELEVPEDATVADVVRQLGIPDEMPRMALVNGQDVEENHRLVPGDVLALFPPLAGGRSS